LIYIRKKGLQTFSEEWKVEQSERMKKRTHTWGDKISIAQKKRWAKRKANK
jgi:hypothetical protein